MQGTKRSEIPPKTFAYGSHSQKVIGSYVPKAHDRELWRNLGEAYAGKQDNLDYDV